MSDPATSVKDVCLTILFVILALAALPLVLFPVGFAMNWWFIFVGQFFDRLVNG